MNNYNTIPANQQVDIDNIKICVLGQAGSGKSSMVLQFTQQHFPIDFDENIEDIYFKIVKINDKPYKLHVLDTTIKDNYSSLREVQYSEADGFIIVYSVDSIESFNEMNNEYNHILRIQKEIPPLILIGNKIDLEYDRQVESTEGEQMAEQLGFIKYFETSAKNNFNVTEPFILLSEFIINHRESSKPQLDELNERNFGNSKSSQSLQRSLDDYLNNKNSTFTTNTNLEKVITKSCQHRHSLAHLESNDETKPKLQKTHISSSSSSSSSSKRNNISERKHAQLDRPKSISQTKQILNTESNEANKEEQEIPLKDSRTSSSTEQTPSIKKDSVSKRTLVEPKEFARSEKESSKCCIIM